MRILKHIIRFIVSAIVIMFTAMIVPQFEIGGFWSALLLALVIAVIGWIVEELFGKRVTPFGRGIVGFLSSVVVIWIAQFLVNNVDISILGAVLAALVIGIVDLFIPIGTPFRGGNGERQESK